MKTGIFACVIKYYWSFSNSYATTFGSHVNSKSYNPY
jgi:hypothetical protein